MCDAERGCEKLENLKGRSEECSPEQIKECHGDFKEHPCVAENKADQKEKG